MKNTFAFVFLAVFTFIAQLASADTVLFDPSGGNRYAAIDPATGKQTGVIQLKANKQVTFFYGSTVRMHGNYKIFGRNLQNRAVVDTITAQLSDTENTSLLVNTVRLEISFNGAEAERIKNSSGVQVNLKIWLNTASQPRVMSSLLRRL
jgi:hypothetical protein